jgi:hypothetical protein
MIDHGQAFHGLHWDFPDSPADAVYSRRRVYQGVRSLDDFAPWLDQVARLPEGLIEQAREAIPFGSIRRDQDDLERLLERLCQRRTEVSKLLSDCRASAPDSFPSWAPFSIYSVSAKLVAAAYPLMRTLRGFVYSPPPTLRKMRVMPRPVLAPMWRLNLALESA